MKTWVPLVAAIVLGALINIFPAFMAFVVKAEGWGQTGWVFYFFTIPAAAVLFIIGAIVSLVLFFIRRGK